MEIIFLESNFEYMIVKNVKKHFILTFLQCFKEFDDNYFVKMMIC